MVSIFKGSAVTVYFMVITTICLAQKQVSKRWTNIRISERGIVLGAGYGIDSLSVPNGNYTPLYCIARVGIDFRNKNALAITRKGQYSIFLEPQINPVLVRKNNSANLEFEYGVNIGFQHIYPLTKDLYSAIFIATGPHYFSTDTEIQAPGFIFSDNFGAGIYCFLYKEWAMNAGFRLRHMSNAQTRLPNSGINTFNFMIGISKMLRK